MGRFFNFTSVERVCIGTGAARITRVTDKTVEYVDEGGRELCVDLEECERIGGQLEYAGAFPPSDDMDWASVADGISHSSGQATRAGGCVGLRGALDAPPWFQFLNQRRTQFEFKNRDALHAELLTPMGRNTFDAC